MDDKNLDLIKKQLLKLSSNFNNYDYLIPAIWLNNKEDNQTITKVSPIEYFLSKIDQIYDIHRNSEINDFDVEQSIIYNFLPRLFTAFDHNGDGKIEAFCDNNTFRETGTFLKTIAMLPNLKKMGVNTIYMLPIFEIGKANRKGNLGSVYAIKNVYKFDDNLNEPIIEIPTEQQFSALVEAAHLLGMKVIMEFIFRTASLDSDLIIEHHDWFYWIYSNNDDNIFSPPKFSRRIYSKILQKINDNDFSDLPHPLKKYIKKFSQPPATVTLNDGEYIGITNDKRTVKVPSAFADWPPNDLQPLWKDVTYFKLYEHPDYNYMAYNTIRMYSTELAREENKIVSLWNYLENIIPFFIKNYNIDGAMVDMGHSFPPDLLSNIINRARESKSNFIFIEENFDLTKESKEKGFDAVIGPVFLIENDFNKLKQFLNSLENNDVAIPFLATSENHNTPRTYAQLHNKNYSKMIFVLNSLVPGILFIHSGFELFEDKPINTGLNFTQADIEKFDDEDLALFSISSLNWEAQDTLIQWIHDLIDFRKEWFDNAPIYNSNNFHVIENRHFLEIELYSSIKNQKIGFIAKYDKISGKPMELNIDLNDVILSNGVKINGQIIEFEEFGFLLFKK
ncbi:MAG: alpha-amylase family glycosyl hydrolase [Chloroherpetonaceae bacterium]